MQREVNTVSVINKAPIVEYNGRTIKIENTTGIGRDTKITIDGKEMKLRVGSMTA